MFLLVNLQMIFLRESVVSSCWATDLCSQETTGTTLWLPLHTLGRQLRPLRVTHMWPWGSRRGMSSPETFQKGYHPLLPTTPFRQACWTPGQGS